MSLNTAPVRLVIEGEPAALLVHVTGADETPTLDILLDALRAGSDGRGFAYAALEATDWNADLSPWPAPPAFGDAPFAGNGDQALKALLSRALPGIEEQLSARGVGRLPRIIGGYSLAGLFSLWAFYQTDAFAAVAAASPSVWFPGWNDYADAHHPPEGGVAYLSLGTREPKTRNRAMASVGEAIERQRARFEADANIRTACLEWNEGGHFADPEGRTARAFAWALRHINATRGE